MPAPRQACRVHFQAMFGDQRQQPSNLAQLRSSCNERPLSATCPRLKCSKSHPKCQGGQPGEPKSARVTLLRNSPPDGSLAIGFASPQCRLGPMYPTAKMIKAQRLSAFHHWGHLVSHPTCAAAEPGEGRRLRQCGAKQWSQTQGHPQDRGRICCRDWNPA